MRFSLRTVPAWLLVLAGVGILFQPAGFFVRNVPDDGFYYLVVARNLAAGLGPTFDGLTVTNGFHPLFAFVLATMFRMVPETPLGDIRLALAFGSVCHLLTGWILLGTVRRLGMPQLAGLAALLYWFNPYALLRSLSAMEPPLYALLLALLFYLLTRFESELQEPATGLVPATAIGLVGGGTLLARTDAIFLLPLVALHLFLPRHRAAGFGWRQALCLTAGAGIAVLPWALYSWKHFGTVWQYSGLIKNHARWQRIGDWSALQQAASIAGNFGVWIRKALITAPLVKYLGIALLVGGLRWREWGSWARSVPRLLWMYLAFVGFAGLYYAAGYDLIRGWYIVPASITMSLVSVHVLHHLPVARRLWARPAVRRILITLLLIEGLLYPAWRLGRGINREQTDMYAMVEWADNHLEVDERIGAFNAGIASYYLDNPVVNLDGLMNNEILAVVQQRSLGRYLDGRGIRYILDQEWVAAAMRDLGGDSWFDDRVRVRHRLRGPEKGIEMIVWEIVPAGDGGGER